MHTQLLSCVQLFATPWTVAYHAPLSMGFSRQEYCSGLPFPPPGYLPNPGTEPTSLASPALAGSFFTTVPRGKPKYAIPTLKSELVEQTSLNILLLEHFEKAEGNKIFKSLISVTFIRLFYILYEVNKMKLKDLGLSWKWSNLQFFVTIY